MSPEFQYRLKYFGDQEWQVVYLLALRIDIQMKFKYENLFV